jgi:hypothetical protein
MTPRECVADDLLMTFTTSPLQLRPALTVVGDLLVTICTPPLKL